MRLPPAYVRLELKIKPFLTGMSVAQMSRPSNVWRVDIVSERRRSVVNSFIKHLASAHDLSQKWIAQREPSLKHFRCTHDQIQPKMLLDRLANPDGLLRRLEGGARDDQ